MAALCPVDTHAGISGGLSRPHDADAVTRAAHCPVAVASSDAGTGTVARILGSGPVASSARGPSPVSRASGTANAVPRTADTTDAITRAPDTADAITVRRATAAVYATASVYAAAAVSLCRALIQPAKAQYAGEAFRAARPGHAAADARAQPKPAGAAPSGQYGHVRHAELAQAHDEQSHGAGLHVKQNIKHYFR